jgi:hypothetical protein
VTAPRLSCLFSALLLCVLPASLPAFAALSGSVSSAASGSVASTRSQGIFASGAATAASLISAAQDSTDDEEIQEVHAKKLAGSVRMAVEGSPLALVLVEECDSTFSNVLASTHTDHYGNFSLKPARRGKVHYLRLSAQGFGTREYEVTLAPDAPDLLKLEMKLTAKRQSLPASKTRATDLES